MRTGITTLLMAGCLIVAEPGQAADHSDLASRSKNRGFTLAVNAGEKLNWYVGYYDSKVGLDAITYIATESTDSGVCRVKALVNGVPEISLRHLAFLPVHSFLSFVITSS